MFYQMIQFILRRTFITEYLNSKFFIQFCGLQRKKKFLNIKINCFFIRTTNYEELEIIMQLVIGDRDNTAISYRR